jgi:hypothetical protein
MSTSFDNLNKLADLVAERLQERMEDEEYDCFATFYIFPFSTLFL